MKLTPLILAQFALIISYCGLTVYFWRIRARHNSTARTELAWALNLATIAEHWLIPVLAALETIVLWQLSFHLNAINLNLAYSFAFLGSILLWLYWLCHWFWPLQHLLPLILFSNAISLILPLLLPKPHWVELTTTSIPLLHLTFGLVALGLTCFALLLSFLLRWVENYLHHPIDPKGNTWLNYLPPLLVMERWVFRATTGAFILLSLALLTGIGFLESLDGKFLRWDHKTIFVLLAWVCLGILTLGHYAYGWRGRNAHRWLGSSLALLSLGYLGTKFVLEVLLQR